MMVRIACLCLVVVLVAGCSRNQPPSAAATEASSGIAGQDLAGIGSGATGADANVPAPGSQEDLAVNVGDRVLFATDSSVLDAEAQQTLQRQSAWLQQYQDVSVTIEGHADERGTTEYNLALGDRRANAAKDYLVALGISSERVLTISYGKERPANPASNPQAWQENRRAVTVVNVVN